MKTTLLVLCLMSVVLVAGCATVPQSPESRAVLSAEVRETIAVFKQKDPGIQTFFDKSYGYAVLPKIAKGAFYLGAAYGRGEVFQQGKMVGYCDLKQASLGLSFGGEYFRELLFFRDKSDLGRFMSDVGYEFAAQVTGVAATEGAAAKADYRDGMAVFVTTDKGLMVDLSLGGQKFQFVPKFLIEDTTK
jgi:lipid-binding SYLF domain-containing protein